MDTKTKSKLIQVTRAYPSEDMLQNYVPVDYNFSCSGTPDSPDYKHLWINLIGINHIDGAAPKSQFLFYVDHEKRQKHLWKDTLVIGNDTDRGVSTVTIEFESMGYWFNARKDFFVIVETEHIPSRPENELWTIELSMFVKENDIIHRNWKFKFSKATSAKEDKD
ncbi:MAG: hypothetical protein HKN92_05125 [Chitinophagales bacterium]|nr:hypothetical protein [Chitinophagales bacterium]